MADVSPREERGQAGWSAYDEEKLKQAKKSAGWRWMGYIAVTIGLIGAVGGLVEYSDAKADCEAEAGAFEQCDGPSPAVYAGPGVAFFVLGLIVSLPAEKAAKEAKMLKAQKEAASINQDAPRM